MLTLISVVLAVLVTLAFGYTVVRLRHWRDQSGYQANIYEEVLERALQAEQDRTRTEAEMLYLKTTFNTLATRNSVAIMTDEQVHHMIQAISQLVVAQVNDPTKLN